MREPFTAQRLRLGREQRGLFIQEVAARVGVSSRSVSAWENGAATPADGHLATLADVLRVPTAFFSGNEPPVLPAVLFRNQGRLTARQRDMALAAGVQAVVLDAWMAGLAERPPTVLRDLGDMTPDGAAEALRESWGLGDEPLPPLVPLLEQFGIRVYSLGYPEAEVDAYSLWYGDLPFVLVSTSIAPLRRRVCVAHELGHLVLHAAISGKGSKAREDEADDFAAAFLMPATSVLAHAPPSLTIDSVDLARRVWGVPALVYLRRLRALERLPEWRFRTLCTEAKIRGKTDDLDEADEGGTSPFLERCLTSDHDGAPAREAAASHLRVHPADLDAISFASPARGAAASR